MSDISSWLSGIREEAEAATPGPWWGGSHNGRQKGYGLVGRTSDRGTGNAIAVLSGTGMDRVADARFIASSRTTVPVLVGALQAVMELHRPIWNYTYETRCDCCVELYPCPTVRAVELAMAVK